MRKLLKNIVWIIGSIAIILVAVVLFLHTFTRHNQSYPLPDFSRMKVSEALQQAQVLSLELEIADSLYIPNFPRGCIFRQVPVAGSHVKKGRRIQLTINSVLPRKVSVPSLIGYSLRQAKAELSSCGLELGQISYVPDIATNNVLAQMYKGYSIEAGTRIEALSAIDLRLGRSEDAPDAFIPDLRGKTLLSAKDILVDYSLNIGTIIYDRSVRNGADSLSARIYTQSPAPSEEASWALGSRVNLSLTVDPEKLSLPKDNE